MSLLQLGGATTTLQFSMDALAQAVLARKMLVLMLV